MSRFSEHRTLFLSDINRRVETEPAAFVAEEEGRYTQAVEEVAERLCKRFSGRALVLLSGPSSSGKTTTANRLAEGLRRRGREACTVSLDNFYRGYGLAPQLPDGSYDYESIEALDLPCLQTCMRELMTQGKTHLPVFDFHTHARAPETVPLTISEHCIVIFEGIHALNPRLEEHLSGDTLFKIFINATSPVYDGWDKLLSRKDIRLIRRLLRDLRFRNSTLENTFDMWRQVVRGEKLYLFPYVDTADVVFDTTHAYEPAMLAPHLLPLLKELPSDSPYADTIRHLIAALTPFAALSDGYLPSGSLLCEFLGDKK